jgi:hypothetical protein
MSAWQKLTLGVATFAMALVLAACSSNHPRDIQYGTDADVDFTPPDVSPAIDGTGEDSGNSVDADQDEAMVDGSQDAASAAPNASIDGND